MSPLLAAAEHSEIPARPQTQDPHGDLMPSAAAGIDMTTHGQALRTVISIFEGSMRR